MQPDLQKKIYSSMQIDYNILKLKCQQKTDIS